ncbi:MAG: EAL domain-containing protein [Rhizobium sp.]|nr:EAL domain-containing protein [Rhizobium sp.]
MTNCKPNYPLQSISLHNNFKTPHFSAQVQEALDRYQVPPQMIELEVTEAAATHNPESTIVAMQALKTIGVTLAIDDFGTGYSSLSYLKRFPIDTLKIDIAFVRNIHTSKDDEAIAEHDSCRWANN